MGAVNFYFYDRRTNILEGNKPRIFQYYLNIGGGLKAWDLDIPDGAINIDPNVSGDDNFTGGKDLDNNDGNPPPGDDDENPETPQEPYSVDNVDPLMGSQSGTVYIPTLRVRGGADTHAFSLNSQLTVSFTPARGNTQLERTAINFTEVGI